MKFKEIKPGMIIHCPKEENAQMLLEYLYDHDYAAEFGMNSKYFWKDKNTVYVINPNRTFDRTSMGMARINNCKITEFSDLIEPNEPQMGAAEVLEWLCKANWRVSARLFNGAASIDNILERYTPQEIVDKITAYEAAKKAPKPVEVEYGWDCKVFDEQWITVDRKEIWEGDEERAKDEAAEMANQYTAKSGKKVFYRVYGACRVKEDK